MVGFSLPVPVTWHVRETARAYGVGRPDGGVSDRSFATRLAGEEDDAVADPLADADALEALEEEIVVLAAHVHAGEHRLLELVAEFDRRRGWELGGHRTCAHWLAFRTGLDLGTAREKVRAARALAGLPETSAAMRRGELSFSQVRALTRVATPENETDLLELARGATTAVLERMVRGWKLGSREDETERERRRFEGRELSVFPDEDGMVMIRGRLTPDVGALLMRAVEAASDALYREKTPTSDPPGRVSAETSWAAAQRRADALGLLAERALAAGFGARSEPGDEGSFPVPVSGTRAERYQVLLHVEADTLKDDGSGLGRSELEDGTRVSAETSRRLACDASVVAIGHGPDGAVLDVGRKTRTVSPALRRALEARDRGCRFPGCALRFTDAHHVTHWADGGDTSLDNLVLLCAHHHRLVHEAGWRVEWWGAERHPAFVDPRGQVHLDAGRPAAPAATTRGLHPDPVSQPDLDSESDLVATLVDQTRRRGARLDFTTAGARWKRQADIPDHVWFAALEALG